MIIVDDQKLVLKKLVQLLSSLPEEIERIVIHCKNDETESDVPIDILCYTANSIGELYELYNEKLGVKEKDYYLLDITLFGEKQVEKKFIDYGSVKFANFLKEKNSDDVKIKFYTQPLGISVDDFMDEISDWGRPIYRPQVEYQQIEKYEQERFVKKIKEFCDV